MRFLVCRALKVSWRRPFILAKLRSRWVAFHHSGKTANNRSYRRVLHRVIEVELREMAEEDNISIEKDILKVVYDHRHRQATGQRVRRFQSYRKLLLLTQHFSRLCQVDRGCVQALRTLSRSAVCRVRFPIGHLVNQPSFAVREGSGQGANPLIH